jgi:hypothetical protein
LSAASSVSKKYEHDALFRYFKVPKTVDENVQSDEDDNENRAAIKTTFDACHTIHSTSISIAMS